MAKILHPHSIRDHATAQEFLDRLPRDYYGSQLLRGLLSEELYGQSLNFLTNEQVRGALAARLAFGPVRVQPGAYRMEPSVIAGEKPKARPKAQAGGAGTSGTGPIAPPKKTWIKIRVVDDATGAPIPGVSLKLREGSTGWLKAATTDQSGAVEYDGIEPGAWGAASLLEKARIQTTLDFVRVELGAREDPPPGASSIPAGSYAIANIEAHKVKKGESILSLATANGMTWQELSIFNWGTCVPEEINVHLREEVGCTKKTKDGYNYMFDDSDEPGIVFIPTEWEIGGLSTGQAHVIRVQRLSTKGASLNFILKSETTGHLLPLYPFRVYDSSGAVVAEGKTDENAEGHAVVPEKGVYDVEPGDPALHTVSGKVYTRVNDVPLANAALEVRPWERPSRQVTTGAQGEIDLTDIPKGELVLSHQGAECAAFVFEDISGGAFFIPIFKQGPEEPPPGGDLEV